MDFTIKILRLPVAFRVNVMPPRLEFNASHTSADEHLAGLGVTGLVTNSVLGIRGNHGLLKYLLKRFLNPVALRIPEIIIQRPLGVAPLWDSDDQFLHNNKHRSLCREEVTFTMCLRTTSFDSFSANIPIPSSSSVIRIDGDLTHVAGDMIIWYRLGVVCVLFAFCVSPQAIAIPVKVSLNKVDKMKNSRYKLSSDNRSHSRPLIREPRSR